MSGNKPIQPNKPPKRERVIKFPEYWKFVEWCATPTPQREQKFQKEFARAISVHESTLSVWKNVDGFDEDRLKAIKAWAKDKTPTVVKALLKKIILKGEAAEAKLWLQFIEGWQEKSSVEQKIEVEEKLSEADKQELLDAFDLAFYGKKKNTKPRAS